MDNVKHIYNLQIDQNAKTIIGDRIKQARVYRGLSQHELAEKIGVTKQAISKYESSKSTPTPDVIAKLPSALQFPIKFFFKKKDFRKKEKSIVYFRSKSIPKKTRDQLKKMIELMDSEVISFYSKYIDFPNVNLPNLSKYVKYGKCNYDRDEIIEIVRLIRNHWGLENNPIANLAHTLQINGFILSKTYINQNKTDGFSQWISSIPYIITSSNKESAVRTRFDDAHEFGHLVLHPTVSINEQGGKSIEDDANFFASEFIYPSSAFIKDIQGLPISFETFILLKEKWKVAIQTIVRKCLDLELISEDKYTYFQKRISYKGWRKKEPLDDILKVEEPRLLKDATKLLLDNNIISKQDILEEIYMSKEDIIALCNFPKDYFDLELSNVIKLF